MKTTKSDTLSRRAFLTTAGGLTIGITAFAMVPRMGAMTDEDEAELVKKEINAWVHLHPDGTITIYSPAAEMGQGSLTALPVIFAEEMDADWSKVKIEQSPVDVETFGMQGWRGGKMMLTVGSFTVKRYFDQMRQAGAQARYVLLQSVASKWNVSAEELTTDSGVVYHQGSNRKIAYGEILNFLEIPDKVAEIPASKLKKPEDFKLIGKVNVRHDIPSKVDGTAIFALDVMVEGMVYGVIERGKIHGAKPDLLNEAEMRGKKGLIEIVVLDHGIGVVADTLERALALKKDLKIAWSEDAPSRKHSTSEIYQTYAELASAEKAGNVMNSSGDIQQAMKTAAKTYQADYLNDYVYHAQMEPLNAVAWVKESGAEIWVGSQGPGFVAGAVGEALGMDASKITVHQQFLGGGLGRRSLHDYVIEASLLSRAVARPVKLLWTREDDLQYGYYRPLSLQRMKAAVDGKGMLTGFSHTIVGDGSGLLASGARNEFYDIPSQHLEMRSKENGIHLKHWRSVGHGPNKFAIESFIDEIAADQGIDPLEYRRRLMKNHPRALAVLNKAAAISGWGKKLSEGRAMGIAFGERSGSLAAGVCEISLDESAGKIRVHHFWAAVDAGIVIQPDNVIAQMEGGIVMGISSVLSERVSINNGEVQESNFHNYPLLRMKDAPDSIEIAIIPSVESPQGVGEASTPLVGGAIANAFGSLTGKRLRHMPFTPEQVKSVLGS